MHDNIKGIFIQVPTELFKFINKYVKDEEELLMRLKFTVDLPYSLRL